MDSDEDVYIMLFYWIKSLESSVMIWQLYSTSASWRHVVNFICQPEVNIQPENATHSIHYRDKWFQMIQAENMATSYVSVTLSV